jgi:hypothetical protein
MMEEQVSPYLGGAVVGVASSSRDAGHVSEDGCLVISEEATVVVS